MIPPSLALPSSNSAFPSLPGKLFSHTDPVQETVFLCRIGQFIDPAILKALDKLDNLVQCFVIPDNISRLYSLIESVAS